ncbi:VOC family protein [Robertkochia aurantiaca]|uniref:VOC family protein n=1 Tax=Robertkochia aurantiaca TaxID=2873700 RepID=UPI001CC96886|nr:VOC family protein [Robertkochia sp. 3YJGBD-33]
MSNIQPFHLAIPVDDLDKCRKFYRDTLKCPEGRSSDLWVDFDFFGHQLVIHHKPREESVRAHTNPVDGKDVPVPHFGVVLKWEDFHNLVKSLREAEITFEIEPYIRFEGQPGEQATMFFRDPSGNALEFKSFKDPSRLFAS